MRRAMGVPGALLLVLTACGPRFDVRAISQAEQFQTIEPTAAATSSVGSAGTGPSSRTTTVVIPPSKNQVITGGVIKVGGLFPTSGGLSRLGNPALQGAQAYFNWVNDHGGVLGKKFKFIPCDDQADDTQSTVCAKKLVEQDGVFIMGPSFTPFSLTVINYLQQSGVPWIGYDGINIEGFDAPNVVTVGAPIETMGHVLLPQWFNKVKQETGSAPTRIGAVVLDVAPAKTYLREARNVICPKLGCQIVREQQVNYTTTEYGTICTNMQNDRVDAVWIVTDPSSAAKLLVSCQGIGYKPPKGWLGQHGIYLDLTLRQAGPFANGMLANGAVLPDTVDAPATREMKQIIRTYYPDASFGYFTELSYASARMVVDLVQRTLGTQPQLSRVTILQTASSVHSYDCNGLCKDVNLEAPARRSGGNHNVWLVRASFSGSNGTWVYDGGPFDAFTSPTWPCPGRPAPC